MIRLFKLVVGIVLFCYAASPALSLEVAPRLTDREIIESLAELKQGHKDINKRFEYVDKRFEGIDKRFEGIDKRIDELRTDMNKNIGYLRKNIDELRADMNKNIDDLRADMNKNMDELRTNMKKNIDDLRADMNNSIGYLQKNIDDLRADMNNGMGYLQKNIDNLRTDMNKRMDSMHRTMLALSGMLMTLIVTLFGYIAWDRRTLVKPLQEKLNTVEQNQVRETQTQQATASRLETLLGALRKLATKDDKLASALRSVSLF